MKSLLYWNALLLLTIAAGLPLRARGGDGSETGRGSLWSPKTTDGKPIEIRLAGKHPLQDKLVEMIHRSELPRGLKQELILDLEHSSILYSNEKILYGDVSKQLKMQLTGVEDTVETLPDGSKKTVKKENWVNSDTESQYGFCLYPVNLKVSDLNGTPLAAYTFAHRREVVYFSQYLEQMDEHATLKLVLHEQGHRLKILGDRAQDERFVEGWAAALLAFLEEKTPKEEFFALLEQNHIPTFDIKGFDNEEPDDKNPQGFKARIMTTITTDTLDDHDSLKTSYWVQLKKEAFAGYPDLQQQPYQQVTLAPESGYDMEGQHTDALTYSLLTKQIRTKFSAVKNGHATLNLELSVRYDKGLTPDSSDSINHRHYTILGITDDSSTLRPRLADQVKAVLGDSNLFGQLTLPRRLLDFAFWDPQAIDALDSASRNLKSALLEIQNTNADQWEILKARMAKEPFVIDFTAGEPSLTGSPTKHHGQMTLLISADTHLAPSVETIVQALAVPADEIRETKDARLAKEAEAEKEKLEKELEAYRKAAHEKMLKDYSFDVHFDDHDKKSIDEAIGFFEYQPELTKRLRCLKDATHKYISNNQGFKVVLAGPSEPTITGETTFAWNYAPGESGITSFTLQVPPRLLTKGQDGAAISRAIAVAVLDSANIRDFNMRKRPAVFFDKCATVNWDKKIVTTEHPKNGVASCGGEWAGVADGEKIARMKFLFQFRDALKACEP